MSDLDERRVAPLAGAGLIVRLPGVVAAIAANGAGTDLVVQSCRAASVEGPTPAAALDLRLRSTLVAGATELPALAVVADAGDGRLQVLVHGTGATATAAGGEQVTVAGRQRCLDTVALAPPVHQVHLCAVDAETSHADRIELANGVVAGGAAIVSDRAATVGIDDPVHELASSRRGPAEASPAPAGPTGRHAAPLLSPDATDPAGAGAPPPPTAERPVHVSVLLVGVGDEEGSPPVRAPLPLASPAGPGAIDPTRADLVDLVRCPAGHANNPASPTCRVCDRPLSPDAVIERGERPALGLLAFDDGATFVLDADYVIGRAPGEDPRVLDGRARPLVVDDANRTVSRVHADVRVDGWEVHLGDRGSTNGTYVWDPAARTWVRLVPSEPRRLLPGDRAAVGHRTFRFETRLVDDT